jgi:hypothetical protein
MYSKTDKSTVSGLLRENSVAGAEKGGPGA